MNEVKRKVHYFCEDTVREKYTGQEITAAVLDTGISLHPDFDRRIKAFQDFVNGKAGIYDDCAHGTHVAGILAGSGRMSRKIYSGMAPSCQLCVLKVLDEAGNGSVPQVLKGMEWVLKHRRQYGIRLVNLSVGMPARETPEREKELTDAVEMLWDAGLIVVVSAGNAGPKAGTVAVPGTSRKVITVGACDERYEGSKNGVFQKNVSANNSGIYSGRGPTKECVIKPDIVAPGTAVISCNGYYRTKHSSAYVAKSGTSMATPVVTGAAALLLSKYPDMGNVEMKLRMMQYSDPIKFDQPCGMLNVRRLMEGVNP